MQTRITLAALTACGVASVAFAAPAAGTPTVTSAPTGSAVAAVSAAASAERLVPTSFGMEHQAFGTKVDRNRALASGPTANSVIGCTSLAGLHRRNDVAGVDLSPLLTAGEVDSEGRTSQGDGVVSVVSRNTITQGSLLGGDVRFSGLSSQARTWHNSTGFHNRVSMDLARLVVDGNRVDLTSGQQTINVAGGELTVFQQSTRMRARDASASGVVLRLVLDNGTRVQVGSSYSSMTARVFGPMSGSTWGSQVQLANGAVRSGRTAFQTMPCPGTRGSVRENTTEGITLPDVVETDAIATHVWGVQRPDLQHGYTQAEIANARLDTLGISLSGIASQANVKRDSGTLTRDARGTHLLDFSVAGVDYRDELTPGVAFAIPGLDTSITYRKVDPIRNGIEVVAVEIVLADDTVIELGHSSMVIKRH